MKTVSLDLSKKLIESAKKAGYELPESYFYWWKDYQEAHDNLLEDFYLAHEENNPPDKIGVNAFSLDELLKIMPSKIESSGDEYWGEFWWTGNREKRIYFAGYLNSCSSANPCDCVAELLLRLLQEGYMKGKK